MPHRETDPKNPIDMKALAIVRTWAPEISAKMVSGVQYKVILDTYYWQRKEQLVQLYGGEVTYRIWELMDGWGAIQFLTPWGAEEAGLVPKGYSKRFNYSKKQEPGGFWILLQWLANLLQR